VSPSFVDCPVKIDPLAFALHIGLINPLAARKPGPLPEPAQTLLHLWGIALDPAIKRRVINLDAALIRHLLQVPIADPVFAISAHAHRITAPSNAAI
jgi:hypothetical protein